MRRCIIITAALRCVAVCTLKIHSCALVFLFCFQRLTHCLCRVLINYTYLTTDRLRNYLHNPAQQVMGPGRTFVRYLRWRLGSCLVRKSPLSLSCTLFLFFIIRW